MVSHWRGCLKYDGDEVQDIQLLSQHEISGLGKESTLTFLSLVDTRRIPLVVRYGPFLDVRTATPETEQWFDSMIQGAEAGASDQLHNDVPNSGILVSIDQATGMAETSRALPTEILFFVTPGPGALPALALPSRVSNGRDRDALGLRNNISTALNLKAMLLYSDHLRPLAAENLTPPPSPERQSDGRLKAYFWPRAEPWSDAPSVLKRSSIDSTFAEAAKRRRYNKKHLGGSVAAAASTSRLTASLEGPKSSVTPMHTRTTTSPTQVEKKNKDLVSHLVLAGMRLHGLSQSKARPPIDRPVGGPGDDEAEDILARNETFKLVYHNTLKAIVFVFREHMLVTNLVEHTDAVRDLVDRLLVVFCTDPLADSFGVAGHSDRQRYPHADSASKWTPFQTPAPRDDRGVTGFPFPTSAERSAGVPPLGGDMRLTLTETKGKQAEVIMTPVRKKMRS